MGPLLHPELAWGEGRVRGKAFKQIEARFQCAMPGPLPPGGILDVGATTVRAGEALRCEPPATCFPDDACSFSGRPSWMQGASAEQGRIDRLPLKQRRALEIRADADAALVDALDEKERKLSARDVRDSEPLSNYTINSITYERIGGSGGFRRSTFSRFFFKAIVRSISRRPTNRGVNVRCSIRKARQKRGLRSRWLYSTRARFADLARGGLMGQSGRVPVGRD